MLPGPEDHPCNGTWRMGQLRHARAFWDTRLSSLVRPYPSGMFWHVAVAAVDKYPTLFEYSNSV